MVCWSCSSEIRKLLHKVTQPKYGPGGRSWGGSRALPDSVEGLHCCAVVSHDGGTPPERLANGVSKGSRPWQIWLGFGVTQLRR